MRYEPDIQSGKLSSSDGQTLINVANTVINIIDPHAASVPQFTSVIVPVAAILGLFMIFGHRKNTI
jgi:hypothetical protein